MQPQSLITVFAPAPTPTPPGENLPSAGAYDLIDLNSVLDELDIPRSDPKIPIAWLARTITDVSARIGKYCGGEAATYPGGSVIDGRIFQIEGLTQLIYLDQDPYPYQTPGGVNPLQLARWPLANLTPLIASATVGSGTVLTFASVPASVQAGQPVSHANAAPGTTVVSVASPNVTISAPLILPVLAGDTVLFGLAVSQTLAVGTYQSLGPNLDYTWLAARGSLLRLNPFTGVVTTWEAIPTTVSYFAGYPTIPPDLVGAALEWISWRYYDRQWGDPTLRTREQPGLGTQTRWVGGPPSSGSVPDSISGILDAYREIVVA